MGHEGKTALSGILWELMRELARVEALAHSAALRMGEQGLEDEASMLWDLYTVAGDWQEEVASWIANLARGKEGNDE